MRICLVYDCLFPYTVGGAERWYRNLGEQLAGDGHEVTYLTLRQWGRDEHVHVPGVRVIDVGPRLSLYTSGGRRRIVPPLAFGIGVFAHLLRRGADYEVVHTASFPYFSLLAAAALQRRRRYRLVVDWFEVWSREYWQEYLGNVGGRVGAAVQGLCLRIPQRAFCFSDLHARRLAENGVNGEVMLLEGMYAGAFERPDPRPAEPVVVYAGRHIPEKRVPAIPPALALARRRIPELRGEIFGDGPERESVVRARSQQGLDDVLEVHGFVSSERVSQALSRALCLVLPSRREGYGMVVVEAAALGTPSVVVAGPDNAATDLIAEGVNGYVSPSATAADLAAAIEHVFRDGQALRDRTAAWFGANAQRLSLDSSVRTVLLSYGGDAARS